VHVSHLKRAKQTLEELLKAAGHPKVPIFEDFRLSERDFGVWTRRNKNLLMQSYGMPSYRV